LSGRGLCDELITRPEEPYRLWCVVVCDLETSRMGAPYIYDISRLRVKHASIYLPSPVFPSVWHFSEPLHLTSLLELLKGIDDIKIMID